MPMMVETPTEIVETMVEDRKTLDGKKVVEDKMMLDGKKVEKQTMMLDDMTVDEQEQDDDTFFDAISNNDDGPVIPSVSMHSTTNASTSAAELPTEMPPTTNLSSAVHSTSINSCVTEIPIESEKLTVAIPKLVKQVFKQLPHEFHSGFVELIEKAATYTLQHGKLPSWPDKAIELKEIKSGPENLQPWINQQNINRLNAGEWLNDTIINGYIEWCGAQQPSNQVAIFNTYFFSLLRKDPTKLLGQSTNPLKTKFSLIPVNWEGPFIAILDSMNKDVQPQVIEPILVYLETLAEGSSQISNIRTTEVIIAKVPQQKNGFDCGIFLLYFTEIFLSDPEYYCTILQKNTDANAWKGEIPMSHMRTHVRDVIQKLSTQSYAAQKHDISGPSSQITSLPNLTKALAEAYNKRVTQVSHPKDEEEKTEDIIQSRRKATPPPPPPPPQERISKPEVKTVRSAKRAAGTNDAKCLAENLEDGRPKRKRIAKLQTKEDE
ncbi:hypothetical protein BC938DRAFT_478356, partial [Jimgerdemannia flammicorona]